MKTAVERFVGPWSSLVKLLVHFQVAGAGRTELASIGAWKLANLKLASRTVVMAHLRPLQHTS